MIAEVTFFNHKKNFGFAVTPEGRQYFFHGSEIRNKKYVKIGFIVDIEDSTCNKLGEIALGVRVLNNKEIK